MKHPIKPRLLAALLLTLLSSLTLSARDFQYNGIWYTVLDEEAKTCETKSTDSHPSGYSYIKGPNYEIKGSISLPLNVSDGESQYTLTRIGKNSFWKGELNEITIPEGVVSIEEGAFCECYSLTSVNLPNSLESIGESAFNHCTKIDSLVVPNIINKVKVGDFAFSGSGLRTAIFKNEVSLGDKIFYNTPIHMLVFGGPIYFTSKPPKGVNVDYTFQGVYPGIRIRCKTNWVNRLKSEGFYNTIGLAPFNLSKIIKSDSINLFFNSIGSFYVNEDPHSEISLYKGISLINHKVIDSPGEINIGNLIPNTTYLLKYHWKNYGIEGCDSMAIITPKPELNISTKSELSRLTVDLSNFNTSESVKPDIYISLLSTDSIPIQNSVYHGKPLLFSNLIPDSIYIVKVNLDYTKFNNESYDYTKNVRTTTPTATYSAKSTQTTLTIYNINALSDESCSPQNYVVRFSNRDYPYDGKPLLFDNLTPYTGYPIIIFADYDGKRIQLTHAYTNTNDIYVSAKNLQTGPTTLDLEGSYNTGDAKLDKVEWLKNGKVVSTSQNFILTGLTPETKYDMVFRVTTVSNSGKTYSKDYSKSYTTSALDMEILNPKNVSAKKSIVAAQTNISDEETSVGFQWKKYDAPESLPYSEAYTAVCDGQIEGVINNLQPTYYNVRAFYKDANGKYYYSDLTTFDPTDFSFFQPTVHTYPAAVSPKSVLLKGYALEGTDDIISQGFEYWVSGAAKSERLNVTAASNINTVVAKGQRMTAELTDLKEGTEYTYRAFVETSAGRIYGDELSFTTPGMGAVDDIAADAPEVTVVAYYDLSGRRYSVPQNGFNIVVYSDGTTKKIFFKH